MDTPPPASVPGSAGELAARLGDALPLVDSVPAESFALVDAVRRLVGAVVLTDVGPAERASIAREIEALTARLDAARRDHTWLLVRHPDGRPEHLTQAGSGRLNPQAPSVVWTDVPTPPPAGGEPVPAEVRGTCVLGAAHTGSTGRAHGSIVAALLDEAIGHAMLAAGATGMTARLDISFRRATPVGVPVELRARFTGADGRKRFGEGALLVDGEVTAEATALFVRERSA
ncbi:MAG: PaaI family thioesterase [Acidimicrobiales bacterium]|jgi:acyl-coenzyme A thioesterase PaaI-like protein|nr:PaaI family thioesterase [Acidimicrobiales bacterium]